MKYPKKPEDFVETKPGWGTGIGQRFKAFMNIERESNGAIPVCAGKQCEFFRRGECWATDAGLQCVHPYFWRRVDDCGNVLDRDGWVLYSKNEVEKYKL